MSEQLKQYLASKKKKTPLQELLERKGLRPEIKKEAEVKKEINTKSTVSQEIDLTKIKEELLTSLKNDLKQELTSFKEDLIDALNLEPETQEEKETKETTEVMDTEKNQKKKDDSFSDSTQEKEVAQNSFDYEKVLPEILARLRIPKENQAVLLYTLKGKGSLNSVTNENELEKIVKETVTESPLFQRSTTYKPRAANSNQRATEPDLGKMNMTQRNELFIQKIKELV